MTQYCIQTYIKSELSFHSKYIKIISILRPRLFIICVSKITNDDSMIQLNFQAVKQVLFQVSKQIIFLSLLCY